MAPAARPTPKVSSAMESSSTPCQSPLTRFASRETAVAIVVMAASA